MDIVDIARSYRERKKSLNLMDFDDMLANWLELLRNEPEALREYAERFLHVLVDEYQDTNSLQAAILDLLGSRHRNLMVVGDDHQSIYSFRGANFENILRFPDRYPDVKLFKLETNYRSTPQILDLANRSIVRNRDQFQKELRAVRKGGFKPVYVPVRNVTLQAAFVARRIMDLIMEGIPIREIAVLYRAHYHSMELQMELTRRGIPFEIRSGIRFFEMAHVKDITSYLRVLVNPLDEAAWKRVLGLYEKVGRDYGGPGVEGACGRERSPGGNPGPRLGKAHREGGGSRASEARRDHGTFVREDRRAGAFRSHPPASQPGVP